MVDSDIGLLPFPFLSVWLMSLDDFGRRRNRSCPFGMNTTLEQLFGYKHAIKFYCLVPYSGIVWGNHVIDIAYGTMNVASHKAADLDVINSSHAPNSVSSLQSISTISSIFWEAVIVFGLAQGIRHAPDWFFLALLDVKCMVSAYTVHVTFHILREHPVAANTKQEGLRPAWQLQIQTATQCIVLLSAIAQSRLAAIRLNNSWFLSAVITLRCARDVADMSWPELWSTILLAAIKTQPKLK